MAGTGEAPTTVYVVIAPNQKAQVFQEFETLATKFRLKELNPEFYTDDIVRQTKSSIEKSNGRPVPVIINQDGVLEPAFVYLSEFIPSASGGRRSRRTFRRNNTLHRNVRRHHVK